MSQLYADPQTLRHAQLADMATLLRDERTRSVDVVAHSSKFMSSLGDLIVDGTEAVLDDNGVTPTSGTYRMTKTAERGIADKLGIPLPYLRRMREHNVPLLDDNINSWLRQSDSSYLLRLLRGKAPQTGAGDITHPYSDGIVRAVLSDRYRIVDNLDVLLAVLAGIREADTDVKVDGCDLTETRMYARISAPGIRTLAPQLLAGYRSPFTGNTGSDNPVVFAGFVVSNSEVGGGAFTITPRIVAQVCSNGMTITRDALREVHLGGRLESGVIKWSDDTQSKSLALVTAQTRDAVRSFLDADYVRHAVVELERAAGVPVAKPADMLQFVSKQLAFGEAESNAILEHFITGGQLTAGGVMHAVTSVAQTVEDGDRAAELEAQAIPAMHLAAGLPVTAGR